MGWNVKAADTHCNEQLNLAERDWVAQGFDKYHLFIKEAVRICNRNLPRGYAIKQSYVEDVVFFRYDFTSLGYFEVDLVEIQAREAKVRAMFKQCSSVNLKEAK